MPKITWSVSGGHIDEMEPDEEFSSYDGPMPPRGVYRMTLKSATYTKYSTGSKGLALLLLIDDPRPEKKKFNGCPIFENLIDMEQTDFKIRQWLDAIGANGTDWDNTVIDKQNVVTKFGRVKAEGLSLRASTKIGKNNNDEQRCEIQRFLAKVAEDASGNTEDGDPDDDGEAPF